MFPLHTQTSPLEVEKCRGVDAPPADAVEESKVSSGCCHLTAAVANRMDAVAHVRVEMNRLRVSVPGKMRMH